MVTMWIPTPSMTVLQRTLLYGSCFVALLNSVGLLVLIVQQNQQRSQLEQTESRLTKLEQSSVVEFLQEVPKGAAGLWGSPGEQPQYQYSRNKRSEELEKELQHEPHQEVGKGELQQEARQEVGEEKERREHNLKHKNRHGQRYHKAQVQDDMMMMMTYSMVPVREKCAKKILSIINAL